MMAIFAMKGHAGPLFHGSHSARPLEIRGSFYCSGPQPVEDGGCPQWVADIFDRLPGLERIALDGDGRGVVWSRLLPDNAALRGGEAVPLESTVRGENPGKDEQ